MIDPFFKLTNKSTPILRDFRDLDAGSTGVAFIISLWTIIWQ